MRVKRSVTGFMTAALLVFGMTGCGENQIPDLSDNDVQAVGEYVALTMMKYDINHRSRLMELIEEEAPEEDKEAWVPEEEAGGMKPVEDTPVVNEPEEEESTASSYTVEEVIGLPEGISLTYQGQEAFDSYPGEGEILSLNASQGKKLLVLKFLLANAGSGEQSVDLLASNIAFHVTVNGEYTRRALPTILLNDLSTFAGSVSAGESKEVVLVVEVDESMASAITSLSLGVKAEDESAGSAVLELL